MPDPCSPFYTSKCPAGSFVFVTQVEQKEHHERYDNYGLLATQVVQEILYAYNCYMLYAYNCYKITQPTSSRDSLCIWFAVFSPGRTL